MTEWRYIVTKVLQEGIILEVFQTLKHKFISLLAKPSFKQLSEDKELHSHLQPVSC